MQDSDSVNRCIEAICQSGCMAVRAVIESLERGQAIPQTEGMSADEVNLVLTELKTVMSVYDEPCDD